jgi:hypothetical protein
MGDTESQTQNAQENSAEERLVQSSAPQNEGENHEESETSESDQSEENEQQEQEQDKPKKNGFKKRIDRLNRNLSERDQRIVSLQKELEEIRKSNQPNQNANEDVNKGEPSPDDFQTNAEYIKALNKYYRDLDKAEAKKESEAGKQRETQQKMTTEHGSRLEQFKKAQPDFDDVVADFNDVYGELRASPAVIEAIMTSEYGPNVLYEVLKDHAEYERLTKLSDSAIIREIGKIEARIHNKKEAASSNAQKASKAPAPISPLGKGSTPSAKSLNDPGLSFAEYEKIRRKQQKK